MAANSRFGTGGARLSPNLSADVPISRGEFLHFRCADHAIDGHFEAGKNATYPCSVRGCERPAKAYWYRGEQYEQLPERQITFA